MADKVILGMSGGVDSSVAALRLLEQGYTVTAVFMKNWEEDDGTGLCTAPADYADARQVCERLGIELKTVNFSAEYWDSVFTVFIEEYAAGRTPNPDVLCNQEIKFKAFLDFAADLGANLIATGHYARISACHGGYRLLKGRDAQKDQSYFLYRLGQTQLARALFPLGGMEKSRVRRIAEEAGFDNFAKKDSTGICFIGERRFREFLQRFLPAQPGDIRATDGRIVGRHQGLMFYTLGQRRGLGIGGVRGVGDEPWYVAGKDLAENVLIVVQGREHPDLFSASLEAGALTWVEGSPQASSFRCRTKIRYRQPDQACRVTLLADARCRVTFERPQRAVTPGQSVVFYADDRCLGGGIIETAAHAGVRPDAVSARAAGAG